MAGEQRDEDPELLAIDDLAADEGRRPVADARTRRRTAVLIGSAVAVLLLLASLSAWIALAP